MIQDGHQFFGQSRAEWTQTTLAGIARRAGVYVKPADQVADKRIRAYVNHGRWMVRCEECNSCQVVWPDDPVYLCAGCWNVTVGGKWRPVVFPAERAEIDAILSARPEERTRNWELHETVDELRQQNAEHGL